MNPKQHNNGEPQRCEECERRMRAVIAGKDAMIAALTDEIRYLQELHHQQLEKIIRGSYAAADHPVPLLQKPEVSDAESAHASQP